MQQTTFFTRGTSQARTRLDEAAIVALSVCFACSAEAPRKGDLVVAISPSEMSSLGFAFADERDRLSSVSAGDLVWRSPTSGFDFEPKEGMTPVEHRLEFVDSTLVQVTPCQEIGYVTPDSNVKPDCRTHLRIAAAAHVRTGDGALDTEFTGTLRIFDRDQWDFAGEATSLQQGSFRVLESPLGAEVYVIYLEVPSMGDPRARFGLVVSTGDGESGTATGSVAGEWSPIME